MKKSKYDWNKIKLEFFKSDFNEIAPFIQQRYSKDTAKDSNFAKNTKWWAEEKKDLFSNIYKKAIENYKPDYKEWEQLFYMLEMAHIKGLKTLSDYILKQWEVVKIEEIEKNWNVIKKDAILPFLSYKEIIDILNFIKTYKEDNNKKSNNKISAKEWLKNMKEKII